MLAHEFMLLDEVPNEISILDYDRSKMIIISDDFVLKNYPTLRNVEMVTDFGKKTNGLNYYGITIIDNNVAKALKQELLNGCKDSDDLRKFIALLEKAIADKKYIIHFGV